MYKVFHYDIFLWHLHRRLYLRWRRAGFYILGPLLENYREARLYLKTRHPDLAKLYLPLIIVNVYRKESGVGRLSIGERLGQQIAKTEDRQFVEAFRLCGHTFDHASNFAYSENHLQILDYGEEGMEKLIINYWDQVKELILKIVNEHGES
ncbi:MAG: hypothetical protein WC453_03535 [Patescibacteria group bacterium]